MKRLGVLAIALLANHGAPAQNFDPGEVAFRWNCAPCHGLDGKGDGLPSDLTTLAKKNGGKFPAARVYEIVEETWIGTNVHRRMPIMGFDIRSRSSAIVDYLRRIQERRFLFWELNFLWFIGAETPNFPQPANAVSGGYEARSPASARAWPAYSSE